MLMWKTYEQVVNDITYDGRLEMLSFVNVAINQCRVSIFQQN